MQISTVNVQAKSEHWVFQARMNSGDAMTLDSDPAVSASLPYHAEGKVPELSRDARPPSASSS